MKTDLRKLIGADLGIALWEVERLIQRAPFTYKIYDIPKRSGGFRTIAQPARETKLVQRWLIKNIFTALPVHDASMAYRDGISIKDNAEIHRRNSFLVKFDFKDFFSSIRRSDLKAHFSRYFQDTFDENDIARMAEVCCVSAAPFGEPRLSIGAPSSPLLSNSILFDFDIRISNWCLERGVAYTRYADDMTFSTNLKGESAAIEDMLLNRVRSLQFPRLTINTEKTVHLSKKYQRRVTGLVITNEGNVSLGRERKREISALVHKFGLGILAETEHYRLQGLLGFARDVEPLFVAGLGRKYGQDVLARIFELRKPTGE